MRERERLWGYEGKIIRERVYKKECCMREKGYGERGQDCIWGGGGGLCPP